MKLVIKLSGKVLEDEDLTRSLSHQVYQLAAAEHSLVLIHGGGKQLTNLCRERGIAVQQVQGRRITDAATLEAAQMVFSSLNRGLTAALCARGVEAVGFSGFDGGLTTARRRPPVEMQDGPGGELKTIDFGFVGDIVSVDPTLIQMLWEAGFTPVISCLCADDGQILNVNADTLTAQLAVSLSADRVISVSDVDGIYSDPKDPASKIPALNADTARQLLEEGVFLEGMIPKIQNALDALDQGIPVFQVLSGLEANSLVGFRDPESGTVITR
ncbi:MAG: acetylglutamate kinase [Acidobacteriota bacterium]|nr:MAG: acetylglutamate kinase [Acidobacteriota bacterium]